jgi:hypothetical protein
MLEVECDCGFTHMMPEMLHIGKDSYGWKFMLHSIPQKGLVDFKSWSQMLDSCQSIYDEYGDMVSTNKMKAIILKVNNHKPSQEEKDRMIKFADMNGYELDRECWLFSNKRDIEQGRDGNYSVVEGVFS